MSNNSIDAIKGVGYDYTAAKADFTDEKKIKQTSIFTTNQVAFAPQGSIGQLLNGSQQSSQAAFSA